MIPDGKRPCAHVRRKVGEGTDASVTVDAWLCEDCGDTLLETRSHHVVDGLLDELERLLSAATPGPWEWADRYHNTIRAGKTEVMNVWGHDFEMNWKAEEADAALILAAVNALPDLISELRRLRS